MRSCWGCPSLKKKRGRERTLPRPPLAAFASKASVNEHLAVMLKDKQSAAGWAIRSLLTSLSALPVSNPISHLKTPTFFQVMQYSCEGRRRQSARPLSAIAPASTAARRLQEQNFLANIRTIPQSLHILKRRSDDSAASDSAKCVCSSSSEKMWGAHASELSRRLLRSSIPAECRASMTWRPRTDRTEHPPNPHESRSWLTSCESLLRWIWLKTGDRSGWMCC